MKTKLRGLGVLGALAVLGFLAGTALAEPKTETFGKWSATVDELGTGQDARKTCAASTAFADEAGAIGTLTLSISNDDALPPKGYPAVALGIASKSVPKSKTVYAVFDDGQNKVKLAVRDGGAIGPQRQWLVDNQAKSTLALLKAMRRATALFVTVGDVPITNIEMDGFTKAYRSLGTWCGFPTADIAP